jgi:hypothetical protein
MVSIEHPTLFEEVIDFLSSAPSLEQITTYQPSERIQQRASELLDRQRSAALTADEQHELDELGRLNHFMSMLKIRARQKLNAA